MKTTNALLVFLVMLSIMLGCGGTKDEIKIGAILSLTGAGAEYGQDQKKAISIFENELKIRNTRYSYSINIQDSKSSPRDALNAFQYLNSTGDINVVITVLSSVSMALKPITEEKRIPLFCVGANPNITKDSEFIFRSLPTSEYQTKSLAEEFINKNNLIMTYAILYVNDDMGVGSRDYFQEVIVNSGKSIISTEAVNLNDTDYRAAISKIISKSPDAIFVATYSNSLATALIQLRELSYNGLILSPLEVSYPRVLERAGIASNDVIYVDTEYSVGEQSSEFVQTFQAEYQKLPSLDAILAYDELKFIVTIIEEFGPNPENFKKLKGSGKEYISPIGKFKVNKYGDFLYPLVLKKIINGKPIIIE